MRFQVARYIPQNARPITHPDGLGIVYAYETREGRPAAIAYRGKSTKASWHYSLKDQAKVYEKAAEFFADIEAHEQRKVERRLENLAPHNMMLGTIVYNSWGWEQTNIDFYVIVKTSANYVWLQPIAQDTEETGFMCGNTKPEQPVRKLAGEPSMHRVTMYNGSPSINFKHGCGCVWDGMKPERCSWYA